MAQQLSHDLREGQLKPNMKLGLVQANFMGISTNYDPLLLVVEMKLHRPWNETFLLDPLLVSLG